MSFWPDLAILSTVQVSSACESVERQVQIRASVDLLFLFVDPFDCEVVGLVRSYI